MRWLERFRMAMLMLFRRQAETARLNDELQFHLEQQLKENIARGLSPGRGSLRSPANVWQSDAHSR